MLRWPGRAAAAAALVLGLFLLHGLTADHHMAMPMSVDATAGMVHTGAGMAGAAVGHSVDRPNPVFSQSRQEVADATLMGGQEQPHEMGAMCVALLGSVLLLPILLATRRRYQSSGAVDPPSLRVVLSAAAPPWSRSPSLTRLCIART